MIGLEPQSYSLRMTFVPEEFDYKAINSIQISDKEKALITRYYHRYYGEGDLERIATKIKYDILISLGKESIAKISHSSIFMMDQTVEDKLRSDPELKLYHKIRSSMWRWGAGSSGWNEIAQVYNSILNFSIDVPGFSVAIDHTTGFNEKGYSEHSRIYLDGVFAYNVHYKGEHVMTIGFTIMANKVLLLQQIQNVRAKGNRWRYKLPENLLEYIVDRFKNVFPEHDMYVADGKSYTDYTIKHYKEILVSTGEKEEMKQKLSHLRKRAKNIISFYKNSGKYTQEDILKVNGFTHRKLVLTN